jgi:hypothetical protein
MSTTNIIKLESFQDSKSAPAALPSSGNYNQALYAFITQSLYTINSCFTTQQAQSMSQEDFLKSLNQALERTFEETQEISKKNLETVAANASNACASGALNIVISILSALLAFITFGATLPGVLVAVLSVGLGVCNALGVFDPANPDGSESTNMFGLKGFNVIGKALSELVKNLEPAVAKIITFMLKMAIVVALSALAGGGAALLVNASQKLIQALGPEAVKSLIKVAVMDTLMQASASVNPLEDLIETIAYAIDKDPNDKNTIETISNIIDMVLNLALAGGSVALMAKATKSFNLLSENKILSSILTALGIGSALTSAGQLCIDVNTGVNDFKRSDNQKELTQENVAMDLNQSLSQEISKLYQNIQDFYAQLTKGNNTDLNLVSQSVERMLQEQGHIVA